MANVGKQPFKVCYLILWPFTHNVDNESTTANIVSKWDNFFVSSFARIAFYQERSERSEFSIFFGFLIFDRILADL